MAFADNLKRICKERGTSTTAVVKTLGLSTSKVSRWFDGALPKEKVLLALAETLDCSVKDFFADEGDSNPVNPTNEDESDILRIYRMLDRRTKHEFMSMVYTYEDKTEPQDYKMEATPSID